MADQTAPFAASLYRRGRGSPAAPARRGDHPRLFWRVTPNSTRISPRWRPRRVRTRNAELN